MNLSDLYNGQEVVANITALSRWRSAALPIGWVSTRLCNSVVKLLRLHKHC